MSAKLTTAALATAVGGALALAGTPAVAEDAKIKCWGVAAAGKNHCGNKFSGKTITLASGKKVRVEKHGCMSQSKVGYFGGDWVKMSKADCLTRKGWLKPQFKINEAAMKAAGS